MSQDPNQEFTPNLDRVVFFDGDCGLCHASVRFALNRDPRGHFKFAPLFGETYNALRDANLDSQVDLDHPPDSLLLVDGRDLLVRAKAVSKLLSGLSKPWPLVGKILGLVPRPLADLGYRAVAGTRKILFKAPEGVCPLVPPAQRRQFLA